MKIVLLHNSKNVPTNYEQTLLSTRNILLINLVTQGVTQCYQSEVTFDIFRPLGL